MRVAFLTGEFPVLWETPFLNQITGLIERGHDVDIYADRPQPGVPAHPDVARLRLLDRARYPLQLPRARRQRWRGCPPDPREGMAVGVPVIGTNHSGIPELIEDGVSGYLVPERDPAAIVRAVRHLADHPEQWFPLAKTARARVEEDHIEQLNDRLVGLLEGLLVTTARERAARSSSFPYEASRNDRPGGP